MCECRHSKKNKIDRIIMVTSRNNVRHERQVGGGERGGISKKNTVYDQQDALNHYDDLIAQSDISHTNGHDMTASKSFNTQCVYDDELY